MRTGQSSKKSWQSMAFIFAALVVAGLATVYSTGAHGSLGWGIKHPPAAQMQIVSSGAEDLRLLWQWTDGELQGGASAAAWNLRWSVKGLQEVQALSLAKALGLQLPAQEEVTPPNKDDKGSQKGILWEAHAGHSANSMDMRVLTTGAQGSDGELEAIIYSRLQRSGLPAVEGVIAAVSSALRTAGYDSTPMLSIKVYGESIRPDSADRIAQLADGELLDQYKEDGTVINTYHSSLLSGLVRIGEEDDPRNPSRRACKYPLIKTAAARS